MEATIASFLAYMFFKIVKGQVEVVHIESCSCADVEMIFHLLFIL